MTNILSGLMSRCMSLCCARWRSACSMSIRTIHVSSSLMDPVSPSIISAKSLKSEHKLKKNPEKRTLGGSVWQFITDTSNIYNMLIVTAIHLSLICRHWPLSMQKCASICSSRKQGCTLNLADFDLNNKISNVVEHSSVCMNKKLLSSQA